jgi:hypothetical protein
VDTEVCYFGNYEDEAMVTSDQFDASVFDADELEILHDVVTAFVRNPQKR